MVSVYADIFKIVCLPAMDEFLGRLSRADLLYATYFIVSYPDPALKRGKGSGDS